MLSLLLLVYLFIGFELAGIFWVYDGDLFMGFPAFVRSILYFLFWPVMLIKRLYDSR